MSGEGAWLIRLAERRDGYEIVGPSGRAVDFVSMRELAESENSHALMTKRIAEAQGKYRVRRFGALLEGRTL